jgi:hypothetical protein
MNFGVGIQRQLFLPFLEQRTGHRFHLVDALEDFAGGSLGAFEFGIEPLVGRLQIAVADVDHRAEGFQGRLELRLGSGLGILGPLHPVDQNVALMHPRLFHGRTDLGGQILHGKRPLNDQGWV